MLDPDYITELVEKTDIVELIGSYVKLRRSGANLWGRCPFHEEKSASFSVSPAKNFYHCFGCGKHGSAIDFVREYDQVDFVTAVEKLSQRTGLSVRRLRAAARPAAPGDQVQTLEKAHTFFRERLCSAGNLESLLETLHLTVVDCQQLAMGFAPEEVDGQPAILSLLEPEAARQAGLVWHSRAGWRSNLSNVLVMPVERQTGHLIGFAGLTLDGKRQRRSSTETPVYRSGSAFFRRPTTFPRPDSSRAAVVAPDFLVWTALMKKGLATVCPVRYPPTSAQVRTMLRSFDQLVFLCIGDDWSGQAWQIALQAIGEMKDGKTLRFVGMKLIDVGAVERIEDLIERSITLSQLAAQKLQRQYDLQTEHGREQYRLQVEKLVSAIQAPSYSYLLRQALAKPLLSPR